MECPPSRDTKDKSTPNWPVSHERAGTEFEVSAAMRWERAREGPAEAAVSLALRF
jgi:hypothetical protein